MSSALIELKTFLPKQKEYCLVIGVLNEGERFVNQLQQAVMHNNLVDIIIADGGSDDGSTSPDFLQDKVTAIVVDSRKLGLSAQYQEAMKFAIQHDYKGIIMVDGNGKDSMFSIPLFIEKLEQGADFVQGSRFKQGGGHKNTPSERLFAIKFVFNPLMNFFSGFKYSDAINGYKAIRTEVLENEKIQALRPIFRSYSLQYYLNYALPKFGFKVVEIAVERNYPNGNIPTKIKGLSGYFNIIKLLLATVLGFYNAKNKQF